MAKLTEIFVPLHTTRLVGWLTCAVGFTVIVNVFAGPGQLLEALVNVGVTIIVATIGELPVLTALNEIFPLPVADSPIAVLLFVHVYPVVPPVLDVTKLALVLSPLHTTWFDGWLTCPDGFTVIAKVLGIPGQLAAPFE